MTDDRLRIHYSSLTNLLVVAFIGVAFLMDKINAETALIPLLAVSGIEVGSRFRKPVAEPVAPAKPVQAPPPAGLAGMLLFLALQAGEVIASTV